MFKAEIEVTYTNGSLENKVIYAHSMAQVQDDAGHFVRQLVLKGRQLFAVTGFDTAMVVKHRISAEECGCDI